MSPQFRAILVLACLAVFLNSAQAVPADELTFVKLRDTWNTTGQFKIGLSRGNMANPDVFTPINCTSPLLDACVTDTNQPFTQDSDELLRVAYTFVPKTPMATYMGMQPTKIEIRFCYTTNTSINRAWRTKNKAYPRLSQNCPITAATLPFNGTIAAPNATANTGAIVYNWNDADGVPIATMYTAIWVWCGNQVCAFQSTEGRPDLSPPVNGNFFQTDVEMGITKGMIVACSVLSAIGPVLFFGYWFADRQYYIKHGKPLTIA